MSIAASRSHAPSHPGSVHSSHHSHHTHHSEHSHRSSRSNASRGQESPLDEVAPDDSISQVSSRSSRRELPPPPRSVISQAAPSVSPADSVSQVGSRASRTSHHSSHHSTHSREGSFAGSARLTEANLHALADKRQPSVEDVVEEKVVAEVVEVEHKSRAGTERSIRSSQRGRLLEVEEVRGSQAGSHKSRSRTPASRASTAKPPREEGGGSQAGSAARSHHSSHESVHEEEVAYSSSRVGSKAGSAVASHKSFHEEEVEISASRSGSRVGSAVGSKAATEVSRHSSHHSSHHSSSPPAVIHVPAEEYTKETDVKITRTEYKYNPNLEYYDRSPLYRPLPYRSLLISGGSSPIRSRSITPERVIRLAPRSSYDREISISRERSAPDLTRMVTPPRSVVSRSGSYRSTREEEVIERSSGFFEDDVEVERAEEQYAEPSYRIQRKHVYHCHE